MDKKILVINTGGTFNKVYSPNANGLIVEDTGESIETIFDYSCIENYELFNFDCIDSLDMDNEYRKRYLEINSCIYDKIIIVHGTDTMNETAEYLHSNLSSKTQNDKIIILTGSIIPFSIDKSEASANLMSAYVLLENNLLSDGIYICMNGLVRKYNKIKKDKKNNKFIKKE